MKIFERRKFDVKGRVLSKENFKLARDVAEYKIDGERVASVIEKADKVLKKIVRVIKRK